MSKLRVGVVGFGRAAKVHLRSLARIANETGQVSIEQVASHLPEDKVGIQTEFGLEQSKWSNDYKDVIENKNLDVIVSAGATHTHYPTNVVALQNRMHLFAEKPGALELTKIKELRDMANENKNHGKMTAVNYHRKYHNNFERIKEHVESGAVGKVEMINMVARDPTDPHEEYIPASGGLFKDMSVHDIDMARYLSKSNVQTIYCQGANLYSEMIERNGDKDSGSISFKMDNDVICSLMIIRRCVSGYDQRLELYGSEGTLRNSNNPYNDVEVWDNKGIHKDLCHYMFPTYYQEAFYKCMVNFVNDCYTGKDTHRSTFEDAYQNLKCGMAA